MYKLYFLFIYNIYYNSIYAWMKMYPFIGAGPSSSFRITYITHCAWFVFHPSKSSQKRFTSYKFDEIFNFGCNSLWILAKTLHRFDSSTIIFLKKSKIFIWIFTFQIIMKKIVKVISESKLIQQNTKKTFSYTSHIKILKCNVHRAVDSILCDVCGARDFRLTDLLLFCTLISYKMSKVL